MPDRDTILKFRTQLKELIAEHEILTDEQSHIVLLSELVRRVATVNERIKRNRRGDQDFEL